MSGLDTWTMNTPLVRPLLWLLCASACALRPEPVAVVQGDPLTGSGDINRTVLTYEDLTTGSSKAPIDDGAFALPTDAAPPTHVFEGRLRLVNGTGTAGFRVLHPRQVSEAPVFMNLSGYIHLPAFDFAFVQHGSHLIPAHQGLFYTGDANWNYLVGPGRVWQENGDQGHSRASFPYALIQRNQNCTHNGVMTFLFSEETISDVRYQVTQETCVYFKFDMWGQVQAVYTPGAVANSATLKTRHVQEVAGRLPTKPLSALATDFPQAGVDITVFDSGLSAEHITRHGLVIDGTNYVGPARTRYGEYAFPEQMRMPSYSTAKTSFAGVALMRLAQRDGPAVAQSKISDFVPETSSGSGDWTAVTFDDALDMTTGHYRSKALWADEGDSIIAVDFFRPQSLTQKLEAALAYPSREAPRNTWVYQTPATFLLTHAMNRYLQDKEGPDADIFAMVRDEVFRPLGLSEGVMKTLRSDNSPSGSPFGGWGLFWTVDDIAKVSLLLNVNDGQIDGRQVLHPALLAAGMQRDPNDRGMATSCVQRYGCGAMDRTGSPLSMYNNGIWALEVTPTEFPRYARPFWVPVMVGYGGIAVVMMPNGSTYYHFDDNAEWSWYAVIHESNKLRPHVP